MWNLEGSKVKGLYLGEFPVTGMVSMSRVATGGRVLHYVDLDEAIELPFTDELRDCVVLNEDQISRVYS